MVNQPHSLRCDSLRIARKKESSRAISGDSYVRYEIRRRPAPCLARSQCPCLMIEATGLTSPARRLTPKYLS
jgi:hypothetical protein